MHQVIGIAVSQVPVFVCIGFWSAHFFTPFCILLKLYLICSRPDWYGVPGILPSLLKTLAKQGIMGESEAKPESRNWTSGEMTGGNG
jgi:hypothetical protein